MFLLMAAGHFHLAFTINCCSTYVFIVVVVVVVVAVVVVVVVGNVSCLVVTYDSRHFQLVFPPQLFHICQN